MSDRMTERDLADRVRKVRTEQGLTQEDVANRLGKTIQAVSKAENYTPKDGMTGFRITVLEELTGEDVRGPLYELDTE
jgi:transcriptional regulator with XRE-family HTH domain